MIYKRLNMIISKRLVMNTVREEIAEYEIMYSLANRTIPKRGRMSERLYLAILRNGIEKTVSRSNSMSKEQKLALVNNHGTRLLNIRSRYVCC